MAKQGMRVLILLLECELDVCLGGLINISPDKLLNL
jgi:hypothetical protein